MWSKVRLLSLLLSVVALAACKDDSAPDARIPQPIIPDAKVADAPLSQIDARPNDAAPTTDGATAFDAPPPAIDAGIDAPPPANQAEVILNEVSPNIANDHELVELLVTKAGSVQGISLWQDYVGTDTAKPRLLAVLPDLTVAEGDFIVVHMQPTADITNESASKTECGPGCYATAWDTRGETSTSANIGYSYRTMVLKSAVGVVLDAVPFMQTTNFGNKPAAFEVDLPKIIAEGKWLTACTTPCDYTALANMQAASVNWSGAGNAPDGKTTQRKAGGVNEHKVTDWSATVVDQTIGEANTTN